ncbi:DnaJ domain containing protein [Colletotrichum sojae]|uniref:DnaJ domain containing protein n=1 Tax=Colletotrichum sojae TaxID=2175907 RepID=A0A8H6MQN4_9PEZI|nr:DnaJ domain containing protein [Colletotrichum sojae]
MASLPPDPYKILGVSKDAQLPEIRSAHRKLVLKCHPDKVQDPTLKAAKQDEFQKVQQAYELLSDENERIKYDDNVKLAELRKEMAAKGLSANTSAPRARAYDVNIRTAEPRPDTFRTTTASSYRSPGGKMYSQYPSSRSYDEDLHRPSPMFEPRRSASYEKPSRQEEERDRERERERSERERRRKKDEDREREREREREDVIRKERERIALQREKEIAAERRAAEKAAEKAHKRALEKAAEDKEIRRRERKAFEKAEKEREKERRHAAEDKSRRHKTAPYVEPYGEDETYVSKDKKKSSKKYEEKEKKERARSVPRGEVPLEQAPPMPTADPINHKVHEAMSYAASYMEKSRKGAPALGRAATFAGFSEPPPVAAPTPPAAAPFAPPPPPVPTADDGRTKSRRSSETKTREKSSSKKSPTKESPYVVEATHSPTSRPMPQFVSAHSSPIGGGSPPKHLGRSNTFHDGYSRPPPGPARAQTFHYDVDHRGRGRSRLHPQQISEDEDSEDDRRHRSHRHKARETEAIPLDYGRSTRYAVSGGRTVPVEPVYASYSREESPPRVVYYDARPAMPGRETTYSSGGFQKVKTANRYTTDDVQYSPIPRYRQDEYAY